MRLKRNEAQMMDAKNNSFKETQKLHLEKKDAFEKIKRSTKDAIEER